MWLLSKLCSRSGLLPSSCRISESIKRVTRNPLFIGGFADVHRGQLGSRDVALKVLRVHGNSSQDSVYKVRESHLPFRDLSLSPTCRHFARKPLYGRDCVIHTWSHFLESQQRCSGEECALSVRGIRMAIFVHTLRTILIPIGSNT
jgi:hypothetical protein